MNKYIETIVNSQKSITSNAEDFYKDFWKNADEVKNSTMQKNEYILKKYFPNGLINKKILEIGVGGEGGMISILKDNNKVFGVDVSESAISNSTKLGLDVIKRNLDVDILPFEDKSIDIVLAFEVFEHFSNPQHVIEEINRVLVENGKLLISIPNKYTYHWPRIFYHSLFEKENFYNFLLSNEFYVNVTNDNFMHNLYRETKLDDEKKSWSLYYFSEKLGENDSEKYFQSGKHFWEILDDEKLHIRPVEALELFKKSYYLNKSNYTAKLYYTHALLYRLVYGDKEDFLKMYLNLFEDLKIISDENIKRDLLCRLILIAIELKKFNHNFYSEEDTLKLIAMLKNTDNPDEYLEIIQKELNHVEDIYNIG